MVKMIMRALLLFGRLIRGFFLSHLFHQNMVKISQLLAQMVYILI